MKGDKIVPKPGGVLYSAFILLPLSGTPTLLWSPNATLLSWDEITIMTKVNFEERLFHTMPGIIVALLLIFFYNHKKGKQLPKAF